MPLTLPQYQSRLRWATRLALVCIIVASASGLLLFYDLNVGTTLNILGLLQLHWVLQSVQLLHRVHFLLCLSNDKVGKTVHLDKVLKEKCVVP